jgi:peroxiredoxin Q/BCP
MLTMLSSRRPTGGTPGFACLFLILLTARSLAAPADFTVEAPGGGKPFKLSEAKGKYVALHFLLKTECPYCLRHTRTFAKEAATMPEVVQVFLKPDSAADIQAWTASLGDTAGKTITIYRDPDAKLAKEFAIPDGYQFHGQTVHYPALVLLDPAGLEVFRYVGKDNSDRLSFDQLKAKVSELKAQAAKK